VPLKLAWAITTHKAQGLTLDYVIADVGQVFAEAQLYVALSRASDAKGLELRNFSRNRVRANPIAMKFYEDPTQEISFWWEQDGRARSDPPPSIMTVATELRQPKSRTKKKTKKKVKKERVGDSDDTLRTSVSTRPSTKSVRGKISEESSRLPSSSNMLDGKVFVFIGVLDTISNEDAEAAVLRHGGVVRQSVSSKTDFIVLGEFLKNGKSSRSGAQFRKAKEIIEEQKKMISTNRKFTGLRVLKEESFVKVLFK
jgi:NAD-dependent DNA ligase